MKEGSKIIKVKMNKKNQRDHFFNSYHNFIVSWIITESSKCNNEKIRNKIIKGKIRNDKNRETKETQFKWKGKD